MSEREPEIFEVATTRLGGPSGRGRRSSGPRRPPSVVIVLLIAIAIPAVAFIGPRIEWRPEIDLAFLRPSPTAVPSPTPRPTRAPPRPTASPPPALTIGDGPVPASLPIDVGGIRLIDTSTGKLGPVGSIRLDGDAVVAAPSGDGWWCVCFQRSQAENHETVQVEVRHLDAAARETARFPIETLESTATPPAQDFTVRFDIEFAPDRRTAYIATGVRSGNRWTIAIEAIDMARGVSLGRTDLTTVDIPPPESPEAVSQGYENYLSGPMIRLSPDATHMTVTGWLDRYSTTGEGIPPIPYTWLVDLAEPGARGGPIGRATALSGDLTATIQSCFWLQWLDEERLLGSCWRQDGPSSMGVTTFDLTGATQSTVEFQPDQSNWTADPILDRANRIVYFWSPVGHRFDAIHLDGGEVDTLKADVETLNPSPAPPPGSRTSPAWTTFLSDLAPWYNAQFLADPGGTRLYGLGLREPDTSSGNGFNAYGSTGIWVLDPASFTLVDHWAPAAAYGSIGLSRDGRWMLAVGQPDADTDGNNTAWPPSVAIHDTRDGRLAVQVGDLGRDSGVLLVP